MTLHNDSGKSWQEVCLQGRISKIEYQKELSYQFLYVTFAGLDSETLMVLRAVKGDGFKIVRLEDMFEVRTKKEGDDGYLHLSDYINTTLFDLNESVDPNDFEVVARFKKAYKKITEEFNISLDGIKDKIPCDCIKRAFREMKLPLPLPLKVICDGLPLLDANFVIRIDCLLAGDLELELAECMFIVYNLEFKGFLAKTKIIDIRIVEDVTAKGTVTTVIFKTLGNIIIPVGITDSKIETINIQNMFQPYFDGLTVKIGFVLPNLYAALQDMGCSRHLNIIGFQKGIMCIGAIAPSLGIDLILPDFSLKLKPFFTICSHNGKQLINYAQEVLDKMIADNQETVQAIKDYLTTDFPEKYSEYVKVAFQLDETSSEELSITLPDTSDVKARKRFDCKDL